MSTEMTTAQQKLMARRENMAERLAGLGGGSGILRIRTKNSSFVIPPDDTIVKHNLEVVVLDWAYHYSYFESAYVPGETQYPVCVAVGQSAGAMAPSDNSPKKQNDACATCWANQFGSGQGNAKACKNTIDLAVQIAEHGPESQVYLVAVSPTALKNWKTYSELLGSRNYQEIQVVTRLGFDDNVSYDKLTFAAARKLEKSEEFPAYVQNMDQATQILLTEPNPPKPEDEDE